MGKMVRTIVFMVSSLPELEYRQDSLIRSRSGMVDNPGRQY